MTPGWFTEKCHVGHRTSSPMLPSFRLSSAVLLGALTAGLGQLACSSAEPAPGNVAGQPGSGTAGSGAGGTGQAGTGTGGSTGGANPLPTGGSPGGGIGGAGTGGSSQGGGG